MLDVLTAPRLIENSEVDICVGNALFVALLETVEGESNSLLMDGCVRVGSPVTLRQGSIEVFGRVERCEALGEGLGFRVAVLAVAGERKLTPFDWPGQARFAYSS